jgi:hypothetical protein
LVLHFNDELDTSSGEVHGGAVDEGLRGESNFEGDDDDEGSDADDATAAAASALQLEAEARATTSLAHASPAPMSLEAFLSSPADAASPFEAPPSPSARSPSPPRSPGLAEARTGDGIGGFGAVRAVAAAFAAGSEAADATVDAATMAEASLASVELEGPRSPDNDGRGSLFGDDDSAILHASSVASLQAATEAAAGPGPTAHADLAAVAALEEMVGDLLAQKLSWCERSAAHDGAAQRAVQRCAAAEAELAASAETVALLAAQAERDAHLAHALQAR